MTLVKKFESLKSYKNFAIRIIGPKTENKRSIKGFQGQLMIGVAHKNIEAEFLEKEHPLRYDDYDCILYQFPKVGSIYGTIYGGENHDVSKTFYFCKDNVIRKMIILKD